MTGWCCVTSHNGSGEPALYESAINLPVAPECVELFPAPVSPDDARCYTDGASRGNPGPAAGAYILVDREGKVFEERGWFLGNRTNNEAEYEALIAGMSAAAGHGFRVLSVFSDSELVVRQMQGTYRVRAQRLLPYHTRAREVLGRFTRVSFMSVPRTDLLIQRADLLCNQVLDSSPR
ncbi:MAG: ribonuclease HI family protein [Methanoregulaceae archaeon]|nr:ribonuclease HI family protein [Methanoregulaceae archaeon]